MLIASLVLSRSSFLGACYLLSSAPTVLLDDRGGPSSRDLSSSAHASSLFTEAAADPSPSNPVQRSPLDTSNDDWSTWSTWVRTCIDDLLEQDPTLAGPLIRLAFHDAATFEQGPGDQRTGGPNGSIVFELDRFENSRLSRPLQSIQKIMDSRPESNRISLADCIALAGAQAAEYAGGPRIRIRLGRVDTDTADPYLLRKPLSRSTDRSAVKTTLPSAGLDSDGLRLYFGKLGLTEEEFVALSGVHGLGRHVTLLEMPKACLKNLTRQCIEDAPVALPFVTKSADTFDNSYFKALLQWYAKDLEPGQVAFIPTDVSLVVDRGLRRIVERLARDEARYVRTYSRAFQKLVDRTATTVDRY